MECKSCLFDIGIWQLLLHHFAILFKMISSRWRLPFFTPSPFSHQKTTLPGLKENERRPKASPSLLHSRKAVPVLLMSSCILIGNHTIFDIAALIQEIVLATPPSPHQCTPKCSSQVSAFEATLLGEKTLPKECEDFLVQLIIFSSSTGRPHFFLFLVKTLLISHVCHLEQSFRQQVIEEQDIFFTPCTLSL